MSLMLEIVKLATAILGLAKMALELVRTLRAKKGGAHPPAEENDKRVR